MAKLRKMFIRIWLGDGIKSMSVPIPVGGKMKEILVGFLALGVFTILCYGTIKYKNLGLFILYGIALILIVGAAYLTGACILGTI